MGERHPGQDGGTIAAMDDAGADQDVRRVVRQERIGEALGRLTVAGIVVVCLLAASVVMAAGAGMLTRVLVDAFLWGYE